MVKNKMSFSQTTRRIRSRQQQQQQQVKKRRVTSPLQKVGALFYNKSLIDTMNENCLAPNEKIVLYDATQERNKYVKKSDSGGHDYYIVMNVDGHPVSQIQYSFANDNFRNMTISSETKTDYRKKHYNTILRVATVLLAPTMKIEDEEPIEKIYSRAQNPVSVYSLMKLGFDYENYTLEEQQLDVSFYSPSFQQHQTQEQKKQRLQQQKQLLQYLKQLKQGDDNFEIYMVLRNENFNHAKTLALLTLQRLLGCHVEKQ
jgi:hypothetical protein